MKSQQDLMSRMALHLKETRKAKNLPLNAVVTRQEYSTPWSAVSNLWNLAHALKVDFQN